MSASALRRAVRHLPQRAVHGEIHGGETGQPADELGGRLRREHAGGAHPDGQDEGQRGVDDGLAQEGEEHRLPGPPQPHKHPLPRQLEGHEQEHTEVNAQGGDARRQNVRVTFEDVDERGGEQHGNYPEGGGIGHRYPHREPDGLPHPAVLLGAVVIALHRLRAVGQPLHRHDEHLPDGVDDGHHPHVGVAAVILEGGVAHHLDQAVGHVHKEAGQAQGEVT